MIEVSGSPWLQEQLRSLCRELIENDPIVIEIDRTKWEVPRNRLSPRHHSAEKQAAIPTQINKLLELGVIEPSPFLESLLTNSSDPCSGFSRSYKSSSPIARQHTFLQVAQAH
jgi:hypothetical protein